MLRNCDVCGNEYNVRPADLKRGWGYCCSIKCKEIKKSKEKAVTQWNDILHKYSKTVTLPNNAPDSVSTKFTIECIDHGKILTSIQAIRRSKSGCGKCDRRTIVYIDGKRQCNTCKEWKLLDQFVKIKRRTYNGDPVTEHRCKKCKHEADKKYKATSNGKLVNNNASKKYREKRRQQLLDEGKGLFCDVVICKCEHCQKNFTKRGVVLKRFCSPICGNEYKRNKRIGIKLNISLKTYKCKKCKIDYQGKKPGMCLKCLKENKRIIDKAHKKKRKLALRTLAIEAIRDIKVFERDKWKCKMCNIKVQKVDIYRDDAAEVDHIVPISLGGPHAYYNVQTLCRKCNQTKSNKYFGQLVLSI